MTAPVSESVSTLTVSRRTIGGVRCWRCTVCDRWCLEAEETCPYCTHQLEAATNTTSLPSTPPVSRGAAGSPPAAFYFCFSCGAPSGPATAARRCASCRAGTAALPPPPPSPPPTHTRRIPAFSRPNRQAQQTVCPRQQRAAEGFSRRQAQPRDPRGGGDGRGPSVVSKARSPAGPVAATGADRPLPPEASAFLSLLGGARRGEDESIGSVVGRLKNLYHHLRPTAAAEVPAAAFGALLKEHPGAGLVLSSLLHDAKGAPLAEITFPRWQAWVERHPLKRDLLRFLEAVVPAQPRLLPFNPPRDAATRPPTPAAPPRAYPGASPSLDLPRRRLHDEPRPLPGADGATKQLSFLEAYAVYKRNQRLRQLDDALGSGAASPGGGGPGDVDVAAFSLLFPLPAATERLGSRSPSRGRGGGLASPTRDGIEIIRLPGEALRWPPPLRSAACASPPAARAPTHTSPAACISPRRRSPPRSPPEHPTRSGAPPPAAAPQADAPGPAPDSPPPPFTPPASAAPSPRGPSPRSPGGHAALHREVAADGSVVVACVVVRDPAVPVGLHLEEETMRVVDIAPDTPADKANLQRVIGYTLTHAAGIPVDNPSHVVTAAKGVSTVLLRLVQKPETPP
ncbi:hypothetical protein DIPPA_08971 [Diplonema papillatum]|nr:hypothetical protein DIPPA_08971 [Diplonema papillatum]